jgi:hypothetical protein
MNKIWVLSVLLILFKPCAVLAAPAESPMVDDSARPSASLSISVDRVVIDTAGLAAASASLAGSIDRLGLAIEQLSADSAALDDEQRQILLDAVVSTREASSALTELAQQLPKSVQNLGDRLPQMIDNARAPLADLSSALQAAQSSVAMITESLPLATRNATQLVNSALDAALQKLIVYSVALIAIIALALIGIMWFVYRQYISPLTQKLNELAGTPEHFENMARHMEGTADSLLALQDGDLRARLRGVDKFRRR